jgi:hypothetical protein
VDTTQLDYHIQVALLRVAIAAQDWEWWQELIETESVVRNVDAEILKWVGREVHWNSVQGEVTEP